MTTLQGKFLRSSERTHATTVKTMIPDAETQFCTGSLLARCPEGLDSDDHDLRFHHDPPFKTLRYITAKPLSGNKAWICAQVGLGGARKSVWQRNKQWLKRSAGFQHPPQPF